MLDWHIGLPGACCCAGRPVQMEGRAGQCQLVSRIKTTHLFTEVSCKATGPKQGEAKGERGGRSVRRERERERASSALWSSVFTPCSTLCPALFASYLSFSGCQKQLPRCTEGGRRGGISRSRGDRLQLGTGGEGGVGREAIGSGGQEVGARGQRRRSAGGVTFLSGEGAEALLLRSMLGSGGRRGDGAPNTDARGKGR